MHPAWQLILLASPFATAFRPSPLAGIRLAVPLISRAPIASILCQEADAADEKTPAAAKDLSSEQVDLVNRASDPFRIIRQVLYVTFGVVGLAGVVTSVMQMGDKPGNSLGTPNEEPARKACIPCFETSTRASLTHAYMHSVLHLAAAVLPRVRQATWR